MWAQQDQSPAITAFLLNTTRLESWSFFKPLPADGDPAYTLFGNRATVGVRVNARRVDVQGSFQYAQLVGLPDVPSVKGPLGPGPVYFAAARNSRAYQLYFKSLSLRVRALAPGLSFEVGRMAYASNPESPRLAGRLVGNAEWTMTERAFDGVRVDYASPHWRAHAAFVMPTQGAYEESASPTIAKVQVLSLAFAAGPVNLFGHRYRDQRPIRVRPDNSFRIPPAVDISIGTVGASHVGTYQVGAGHAEVVVWGATQFGDWYGQSHHAFSGIAEVAYSRPRTVWRPGLRAGIVYASGDGAPFDNGHRTFFPMVPTTRPDLLAGTYAQMNSRDLFGEVTLQPHSRVQVSAAVHDLSLANAQDRWYSGTGATAFRGNYFGYSSRPSSLARHLGIFIQGSAEAALTKRWNVLASIGFVDGGDVVRRLFARHRLTVFAVESRLKFGP